MFSNEVYKIFKTFIYTFLGSRYFNITIGDVIFKDILQFSAPCSLDKYLSQWYDGTMKKSVFPYQAYKTIEEIRAVKEFPPYDLFYSDLKKGNVTIEDYSQGISFKVFKSFKSFILAKAEYDRRRQLPPTDPEHMENFACWLKYYQLLDVVPLTKAIEKSFATFVKYFHNNPLYFRSLPALAFKASFTLFDKKLPPVSTFCPSFDFVRQIFRRNQIGGLVNIFHRQVILGQSGPPAATIAPNGDKFSFFR